MKLADPVEFTMNLNPTKGNFKKSSKVLEINSEINDT